MSDDAQSRIRANVLHARRLIGVPDAHKDEALDQMIMDSMRRYHYFDQIVDDVKKRMALTK